MHIPSYPRTFFLVAAVLCAPGAALAQGVVQPAESSRERQEEARSQQQQQPSPDEDGHERSWEAPPVRQTVVTGRRPLHEEELIGEYAQPRWTARRRFPTTRVYVVPPGTAQFEYWLTPKINLDDPSNVRTRSLFELEFGLGNRLQLDLYIRTQQEDDGPWRMESERVELRYALADWGVIPGNPTLYGEFIRGEDGTYAVEGKLLLGGGLAPRWHWGANLIYERELNKGLAAEYAATGAVSYTFRDQKFSLGAELKLEAADSPGNRFDFDAYEALLGPSIQWRPIVQAHVDLVALAGVEFEREAPGEDHEATPILEPWLVVGWEF